MEIHTLTSPDMVLHFANTFGRTVLKECFMHLHHTGKIPTPMIVFEVHDAEQKVAWATVDENHYLWNLCVRHDYRNAGIATELLKHVTQHVRPLYLFVDTFPKEALLKFYMKNGFKIIGREEKALRAYNGHMVQNIRYEMQLV